MFALCVDEYFVSERAIRNALKYSCELDSVRTIEILVPILNFISNRWIIVKYASVFTLCSCVWCRLNCRAGWFECNNNKELNEKKKTKKKRKQTLSFSPNAHYPKFPIRFRIFEYQVLLCIRIFFSFTVVLFCFCHFGKWHQECVFLCCGIGQMCAQSEF